MAYQYPPLFHRDRTMRRSLILLLLVIRTDCFSITTNGFHTRLDTRLASSVEPATDDSAIQWSLFKKHHARGSWKGIWTTYDYIGDVVDETLASVDLNYDKKDDSIQQTHQIVVGAKRSDCVKCFDSFDVKSLPVAKYSPDQLQKSRFASVGMVNGPSLLKSGVMATELVLSHGDGRVRVLFQHAPVWEAGVEPGSGPPQGLKLFRTLVSREALRDDPPTAEAETKNAPINGNPVFYRPVPPFQWHAAWGGTSWTWGPNTGDRGWAIDELEEADAWHGRPTGDSPNCWSLRLGSILLQGPRVVTHGDAGLCRLAWMPTEGKLLRVEASVLALEPMVMDDDTLVGFYPPSLGSLRCDVMQKIGELDNSSAVNGKKDSLSPGSEKKAPEKAVAVPESPRVDRKIEALRTPGSHENSEDELDAARDALSL